MECGRYLTSVRLCCHANDSRRVGGALHAEWLKCFRLGMKGRLRFASFGRERVHHIGMAWERLLADVQRQRVFQKLRKWHKQGPGQSVVKTARTRRRQRNKKTSIFF